MEDMTLCTSDSQEVFQRVWKRVMGDRPMEDSLIETSEGDMTCAQLKGLPRDKEGTAVSVSAAMAPCDMPAEAPAPAQPSTGTSAPCDCLSSDLPAVGEEPPQQSECTTRLRQQVMDSLEGWQFYRHLARRTRGTAARTLNAMAGDLHRQARKLSAAYFLLTGLRYWPSEQLATPVISSYWGALRARHQAEQQQELSFLLTADEPADAALLELYNELTTGCQARCRQLRALLEQSCP